MFLPGQKTALLLSFCLISHCCLAQYQYREVRHQLDKDLVFPVFISDNKAAAKNVNEFLQMEFFQTTIFQTPEAKLFDESRFISEDSISQTGYTSISYQVELNDNKRLSVMFEVEGMGAYPTYYKRYFSFCPENGKPISADTMFTTGGLGRIKQLLIEKRKSAIKKWIQDLKTGNESSYQEDSSFIDERFAACNSKAHEDNIFIRKDEILFYLGDCFPHAWGPYETNLDIRFSHQSLKKYLTEFGKKLLSTR